MATTQRLSSDRIDRERQLIHEIIDQAHGAKSDAMNQGKKLESVMAKLLAARLNRIGYLTLVGAKEALAEFNTPVDIVAWKTSAAHAIAIVLCFGMGDDQVVYLDSFQPNLRSPKACLAKLFIDVDGEGGLNAPADLSQAYIYAMNSAKTPPAPALSSGDLDSDSPF